ncbi:hypothetical protein DI09_81p90 [Mitosporidium daphniae]|uniref:Uncharacterized protein n=1 Tax=Mitosporidium daphniae TaxID=1485682 RepID=A0A098VR26_9MICR|nr:uncharacterized protein DI09_81p90 [Mitosporidium daphniae]KGG50206.1 hypothetical protein DI09_81p90 [Mitosporidium daphniae]|eukprot:XP_013236642.1 uncharacterized protein DI09_81p90 [Mitosporidium daphniae]
MAWNPTSFLLASGSKDGDIVIWDTTSESGQARLKGHSAAITKLAFLSPILLISSSKDTQIKAWDISIQHCFQTVVQEHPIGSFVVLLSQNLLVTERSIPSKERVVSMDISGSILYVHSFDKSIELYRILDDEALKKKSARRKKRNPTKEGSLIELSDTFQFITNLRASHKIRSVSLGNGTSEMKILLSTFSNSLQVWKLFKDANIPEGKISLDIEHSIEGHGHRSGIGWISYSAGLFATSCSEMVKLWDPIVGKSTATILGKDLGEASPTAGTLLSKEWLVVGDKIGNIFIVNTATNGIAERYPPAVPGSSILSIKVKLDIMITSDSSSVYIWSIGRSNTGSPVFLHIGTLEEASDSIVSIALSHDTKFIAVSLIDCTVRIYYRDTLKFFLSLYGHKLPVTAMDFSTDGHLIATASSDKNFKIWGLDFGDCHKSIFAHSEALTAILWIPKTHLLITSSKDRTIKYWDGDTFEHITTLKGHHSEVTALAISPEGKLLFSAGGLDRSCRLWDRSEEQDERDKEADERVAADLLNEDSGAISGDALSKLTLEGNMVDGGDQAVNSNFFTPSTIKSLQSIKSSEKLYEVITLVAIENFELEELRNQLPSISSESGLSFQRRPLLHAYALSMNSTSTMEFGPKMLPGTKVVLEIVRKIPMADLEQAVLMLPLPALISFIKIIEEWFVKKREECSPNSFGAALLGFEQLKAERDLIGKNISIMKAIISHSSGEVALGSGSGNGNVQPKKREKPFF